MLTQGLLSSSVQNRTYVNRLRASEFQWRFLILGTTPKKPSDASESQINFEFTRQKYLTRRSIDPEKIYLVVDFGAVH